jgi:hypothetical protein
MGAAGSGTIATDASRGRENSEGGGDGSTDPAGAIKMSLKDAGAVTPASASDNRTAPLGMGPAGGGGRTCEDGDGRAMGKRRRRQGGDDEGAESGPNLA